MPRLKVLFVASECVPFSKTGGLADVCGALPIALADRGHDVRVVIPRYAVSKRFEARRRPEPLGVPMGWSDAWSGVYETTLPSSRARAYLLEHDVFFDRNGIYGDDRGSFGDNLARYAFLSRGALELCDKLDFAPDVIHVHDWMTALVPIYMDTLYRHRRLARAASVLTIHNLGYQGWFDKEALPETGLDWSVFHSGSLESYDRINLLKGGINHATIVSTVSPNYAREIQTPEGGERLDGTLRARGNDVIGVLNGIDDRVWNPETDTNIEARYVAEDISGKALCKAALQRELGLPERPDVPLFGIVSRFATQKGIDVFGDALAYVLGFDAQWVVLGSGDARTEEKFTSLSHSTPNFRCWVGMNDGLAHRIEAGADFFVMPSRYEPCGLNQLYSQRYGTLPIVRAVGGLEDTVEADVTGFKFNELSASVLANTIAYAYHVYRDRPDQLRAMQYQAMTKPMGWDQAAAQYEALYRLALRKRRMQLG